MEKKESTEQQDKNEIKIDNNPDKVASNFGKNMKKNPWMLVSAVLAIAVVVLLILSLSGGVTGNVTKAVKGDDA